MSSLLGLEDTITILFWKPPEKSWYQQRFCVIRQAAEVWRFLPTVPTFGFIPEIGLTEAPSERMGAAIRSEAGSF
jgi:hypothetical protein